MDAFRLGFDTSRVRCRAIDSVLELDEVGVCDSEDHRQSGSYAGTGSTAKKRHRGFKRAG